MDLPVINPSRERRRLPDWLVKPLGFSEKIHSLKANLRERNLHTVCEEARCPNLGECWSHGTATLMILGGVCTRHCGFCSIDAGKPREVDPEEPQKVAQIISRLQLKHAVITCVARDDLEDGGASQFVRVIEEIRAISSGCKIEVLTTDFQMKTSSMEQVCCAKPDVFNHNLETVERLTPRVRHRATYQNSLEFLKRIKAFDPSMTTKSGIMLGLGETRNETLKAMQDLREIGCEIITIGQYLQPTPKNLPVVEFVEPRIFKELEELGYKMGYKTVASGPFVRSSYHAGEMAKAFDMIK